MRNLIIGLVALCFLSCGNDSNGPAGPSPVNVIGTVWKIVALDMHRTVVSQNPKSTADIFYSDSASIAEKVSGFGSNNFLSFLTNDTLEIYSNIHPGRYKGAYTAQDSTISSVFVTSATTARHLTFTMDQYNQLLLDYPSVEVQFYLPSGGMAYSRTYDSIQDRDDLIATLDTSYHAATMDSLVYSTAEYFYTQQ
jgi:hypothetical protein